MMTILFPTRS